MRILDTNIWVFGTLGTSDRAERLLDEVKTLFPTRLTRMTGLVEAPSSRDVVGSHTK